MPTLTLNDRDHDLLSVIMNENYEDVNDSRTRQLGAGTALSPDSIMGTMPKADRLLKEGILWKLTSKYEWKPLRAGLTTAGLFLARPGEDVIRDLVPLYEIVDVRTRRDLPGEDARILESNLVSSSTDNRDSAHANIETDLFILQIRTIENGYNSGRTYYFNARAEDACNEWLQLLRTEADRAVLRKQAGPNLFRWLRYRLRRFYNSGPFQYFVAVLIFSSFVVNIIQSEVGAAKTKSSLMSTVAFKFTF